MRAAIDDVNSTRPSPRSTIAGRIRRARWTVPVTLSAMSSKIRSSS
jgi:hypothetical protein